MKADAPKASPPRCRILALGDPPPARRDRSSGELIGRPRVQLAGQRDSGRRPAERGSNARTRLDASASIRFANLNVISMTSTNYCAGIFRMCVPSRSE
jgi:hypothetical protein